MEKIEELLYRKKHIEQLLSYIKNGYIEIIDDKYLFLRYRDEGKLYNRNIGEYEEGIYNNVLNDCIKNKSLRKELNTINEILKKINYIDSKLDEKTLMNVELAKRNLVDNAELIINNKNNLLNRQTIELINMKHAWEFILSENVLLSESDYMLLTEINKLVIEGLNVNAGNIRNVPIKINGISWIPDIPLECSIKEDIKDILNKDDEIVNKSIEVLLYIMKKQMFIDGNKRTATVFANHYLIKNGMGIIVVPSTEVEEYKRLLVDYYINDNNDIKDFLLKRCLMKLK